MKIVACPVCGKEFVYNPMSLYKMSVRGKTYRVCGYTCYRKIQKMKENKQLDELQALLAAGTGGNKNEDNSSEN